MEASVEGIGRYAPDIEAAVYFCCLEALQNAAKHAPDAHVTVRVWEEPGGLLFTVADDGPGFDAGEGTAGHGFMNMSDRLGAIGGSVRWDSRPGRARPCGGRSRWGDGRLPTLARAGPRSAGQEPDGLPLGPDAPQLGRAELLLVDVGPCPAGAASGGRSSGL